MRQRWYPPALERKTPLTNTVQLSPWRLGNGREAFKVKIFADVCSPAMAVRAVRG